MSSPIGHIHQYVPVDSGTPNLRVEICLVCGSEIFTEEGSDDRGVFSD